MPDKLVVIADSTQINHFLECPRYHNYNDLERLEPLVMDKDGQLVAIEEPKEAIVCGTYGHKLLELYYESLACNNKVQLSMDLALNYDPYKACEDKQPFSLEKPTVELIKQRFREYVYTHHLNDIVPANPEAIEVGFSTPIYETESRLFILEGRVDLIGSLGGQPIIVDHKFQMRPHKLYKKSVQFRNYALATDHLLLMINYVRLTKGISKDTFHRDLASFSRQELEVWRQRLIQIYEQMVEAQHTNQYEQNWSSCSGKYSQECPYTPLCEEWNKDIIEAKKRTMYWQKEAYKPW